MMLLLKIIMVAVMILKTLIKIVFVNTQILVILKILINQDCDDEDWETQASPSQASSCHSKCFLIFLILVFLNTRQKAKS